MDRWLALMLPALHIPADAGPDVVQAPQFLHEADLVQADFQKVIAKNRSADLH
jgi:hypothetical protein